MSQKQLTENNSVRIFISGFWPWSDNNTGTGSLTGRNDLSIVVEIFLTLARNNRDLFRKLSGRVLANLHRNFSDDGLRDLKECFGFWNLAKKKFSVLPETLIERTNFWNRGIPIDVYWQNNDLKKSQMQVFPDARTQELLTKPSSS